MRIGTAEIYRQVERFEEVPEAIAVGQQWDGDTRVVLFVRMAPGHELDRRAAATAIRAAPPRPTARPATCPPRIVAVDDIPRTRSGKLTELAVADVVNGRQVRNREALANPEALELFRDRSELRR